MASPVRKRGPKPWRRREPRFIRVPSRIWIGLKSGAARSDGVIHLAFNHDFSKIAESGADEQRALEAIGAVLEGSDRPLVVTSGIALLAPGSVVTEQSPPRPASASFPRNPEGAIAALAKRGVRATAVRLPPSVHSHGDHGFVPLRHCPRG